MSFDPWAIDSSGGSPAYGAGEARIGSVLPFVAGAGTALAVRSGVRLSGSGTDLLVQAQSTPNMSVKVNPGTAIIQGSTTSTQGPYTYSLDVVTNVTIAAAHATLDRTDLIVVRIRDANVDTSGARDGGVIVIQGTNGGGVPSIPTDATYYVLAQISVVHAVTSITSGAITDKRGYTAALGASLPFPSTNRPSTGLLDGQRGLEVDTGLPYTWRAALTKWLRDDIEIGVITDDTWASTTTLRAVTSANTSPTGGFAIPMDANSRYFFRLRIILQANSGVGLAVNATGPSGGLFERIAYQGVSTSGSQINQGIQSWAFGSSPIVFGYANGTGMSVLEGDVTCGSTAGTCVFQFAQGVSNAANSYLLVGSSLRYRQIS